MEPSTIAVIHTSPATIEVFGQLLARQLPGARVINLLDDSVLPQLRDNGGDVAAIAARWQQYAQIARERGAQVILNACSSIGELCAPVEHALGVPVVRVDAAMAASAVASARRVAVVATLHSTLGPTTRLLEAAAREQAHAIEVVPVLVEGAYAALIAGDREGHDRLVAEALARAAGAADRVVLAQASMARVLPRLTGAERSKCLTSPELAVQSVVQALASVQAKAQPAA